MKIAVLTLRLHKNYGGIMQNYALCEVLKQMGHDVNSINIFWGVQPHNLKYYILLPLNIFRKYVLGHKIDLKINQRKAREVIKQDFITNAENNRFKERYIPLTQKYDIPSMSLNDLDGKYDAYIVGSDQVWRPKYTRGIYKYYLDFVKSTNAIRLSYAASFGCDKNEYTEEEKRVCGTLLKRFNAVSVREYAAIDLVKGIFNYDADVLQHVDPTFLLPATHYSKFIKKEFFKSGIFQYILDITPEKNKAIAIITETLNCNYHTLLPDGLKNSDNTILPPIEKWLTYIATSDFVITDSFHGTVFSIIFNKPFIVYGNKERGLSRFETLLSIFGLEDRFVNSLDCVTIDLITKQIDWSLVNEIILRKSAEGRNYLKQNLL